MNKPAASITELNLVVEAIIRKWMVIVELDVELSFCYSVDDPVYTRDKITGYECSWSQMPDFGEAIISDNGDIQVYGNPGYSNYYAILTCPLKIKLPERLHNMFNQYCASDLFEADLDYIGLVAVSHYDDLYQFSMMSYFSKAVRQLRLDAYTETLLRPNPAALIAELKRYIPWFDYAATLAEQTDERRPRAQLIADMNLLIAYLTQGGDLNFAKITSLCDLAGSLQPVRSLISVKMPELAA